MGLVAAVAIVVATSSCRPPDRPTAGPIDSAGIAIITSAAPQWSAGHGWVVADTPVVEFRGAGVPGTALRLSDGRVVVADGAPARLLYYSAQGRLLYEVGSASDGPAALQNVYHLDLGRADTVAVYDLAQAKVLLFDPNGALALARAVERGLVPAGSNGYLPRGLAPDGRYLLQRDEIDFPFRGKAGEVFPDSSRLFWFSRQGSLTDSTARLRVGELFGFPVRAGAQEIVTPLARPLAPALRTVAGPALVWSGDGSHWEIQGIGATGAVVKILRADRPRAPLTAAFRDSFVARFRARVGRAERITLPAQLAAALSTAPFPEFLPAYGDLLAGEDSTVWAQHVGRDDGLSGDPGLDWTVFDAAGRWLGEVTMPPMFRPTAVGRGWVLGLQGASDVLPVVRLYPLVER